MSMKCRRLWFLLGVFSGLLLLLADASAAAKYNATLLPPPSGFHSSRATGADGGLQVGNVSETPRASQASIWNSTANMFVDLTPSGFRGTTVSDIADGRQVGYGYGDATANRLQALMWAGSAESYVNLHPDGYQATEAHGIFGNQQVGSGYLYVSPDGPGERHALHWTGTAESVVDLHPSGHDASVAYATTGSTQVGSVTYHPQYGTQYSHAALWNGTAESFVNLNPSGFEASVATTAWGDKQAGWGRVNGDSHALLWSGTAASVADLHPAGFRFSEVADMLGSTQVGSVDQNYTSQRAFLWNSSADDFVDLHQFLSDLPSKIDRSFATGIAADGQIVGYGFGNSGMVGLLWTPVPEPASGVYLAVGVYAFGSIRMRRSLRFRS